MSVRQIVKLDKDDREHMIEWLTIWTENDVSHWEKCSDEHIEMNYRYSREEFGLEW